jgi:transcriptional regulator with XRE-family HTH domain
MPIKDTFAQRLIKIRKARGLSQYELADISAISQRMIAHYETKSINPPAKAIIKLAKALNVTADELIGSIPTKEKAIFKNRQLLKKIQVLDSLPLSEQKTIINLIDSISAKYASIKAK